MEINQLKAMAYDLIAQREGITQRLQQVNQEIGKLVQEGVVKHKQEMKAKAKEEKKTEKTKIGSITTV